MIFGVFIFSNVLIHWLALVFRKHFRTMQIKHFGSIQFLKHQLEDYDIKAIPFFKFLLCLLLFRSDIILVKKVFSCWESNIGVIHCYISLFCHFMTNRKMTIGFQDLLTLILEIGYKLAICRNFEHFKLLVFYSNFRIHCKEFTLIFRVMTFSWIICRNMVIHSEWLYR